MRHGISFMTGPPKFVTDTELSHPNFLLMNIVNIGCLLQLLFHRKIQEWGVEMDKKNPSQKKRLYPRFDTLGLAPELPPSRLLGRVHFLAFGFLSANNSNQRCKIRALFSPAHTLHTSSDLQLCSLDFVDPATTIEPSACMGTSLDLQTVFRLANFFLGTCFLARLHFELKLWFVSQRTSPFHCLTKIPHTLLCGCVAPLPGGSCAIWTSFWWDACHCKLFPDWRLCLVLTNFLTGPSVAGHKESVFHAEGTDSLSLEGGMCCEVLSLAGIWKQTNFLRGQTFLSTFPQNRLTWFWQASRCRCCSWLLNCAKCSSGLRHNLRYLTWPLWHHPKFIEGRTPTEVRPVASNLGSAGEIGFRCFEKLRVESCWSQDSTT